jgi:hypothetical protein
VRLLPSALLLTLITAAATAQETTPAFEKKAFAVTRASSAIAIDGVLDEAAWSAAARVPLEFEWEPGDNIAPPVRTDAFVTYDDSNLYFGFHAFDSQPGAIRAHLRDRDDAFLDDTIGIMLDPFNDRRRAVQFRVNALGVQMDAVNSDVDGTEDWSWDAIWNSSGRIVADGYVVEVAIPFHALRFPRGDIQTWGIRLSRDYPRSVRHRIQSNRNDRNIDCLVCQFDSITGLKGISPGRNLELDPTLTATQTASRADLGDRLESEDTDFEPGLTARWGITPNMTLNAAINPDFSQVEADVAQLSENERFALFFAEKRPFFLEGADFFGTPITAVFTRTVADPVWGLKLTGKEGRNGYGIVIARDEFNNLIFPANEESDFDSFEQNISSAVLRYRRDVGGTSNLGVLYTHRDGGDYANDVAGVDGVVRLGDSDSIRFQYLASRTEYPETVARDFEQPIGSFDGDGGYLSYQHADRDWFWRARYQELSPDFRADAGFINRVDTRRFDGGIQRTFRGKPEQWLTQLVLSAFADRTENYDGLLTDQGADIGGVIVGRHQTIIEFNLAPNREYFDGVTYDNFRYSLYGETRPTGDLTLMMFANAGETIDFSNSRAAEFVLLEPAVEFSVGRHAAGRITHTFQTLDVAGGELFEANLTQARLMYFLNLRTFVRAIVQYQDVERNTALYLSEVEPETEDLFTQFLFSYKVNPQTVILAGYSDNHTGLRNVDLTRTDRTFFLKLGYAWLF